MSERMGIGRTANTELPNALNSIPTSIILKSLANPCIANTVIMLLKVKCIGVKDFAHVCS